MNRPDLQALRELVADILDVEPSIVTLESGPGRLDQWDSLAQLSIITAVEEAYGVQFEMSEIQQIDSLGALLNTLSARLSAST